MREHVEVSDEDFELLFRLMPAEERWGDTELLNKGLPNIVVKGVAYYPGEVSPGFIVEVIDELKKKKVG